MTTTAVARVETKRDIRSLIQSDRVKEQIALALPKHLTPDRMMRVALTTINRNPKLLGCTPESLLSGLMLCSQVGLEPDGRNAHLIPYGDQCQVIFDYKGLIALARRNGVKNIASDVVCEGDTFEWVRTADGLQFKHLVDWKQKRGAVYAAYCIWKDGDVFDGEVMTKDDIEGIRKRSRAGNNGPWVTDWNEMAKKTVVRRASKKWPLDPETAAAFNADDDVLKDVPQVTRPVFAATKPALFEPVAALPAPEPETPPSNDDGDLGPQQTPTTSAETAEEPAAESAQPEKKGKKPSAAGGPPTGNALRAVKELMTLAKVKEGEVLETLRGLNRVDESLASLEEISMVSPSSLEWAYNNWQTITETIKKMKEAGK